MLSQVFLSLFQELATALTRIAAAEEKANELTLLVYGIADMKDAASIPAASSAAEVAPAPLDKPAKHGRTNRRAAQPKTMPDGSTVKTCGVSGEDMVKLSNLSTSGSGGEAYKAAVKAWVAQSGYTDFKYLTEDEATELLAAALDLAKDGAPSETNPAAEAINNPAEQAADQEEAAPEAPAAPEGPKITEQDVRSALIEYAKQGGDKPTEEGLAMCKDFIRNYLPEALLNTSNPLLKDVSPKNLAALLADVKEAIYASLAPATSDLF